MFYLKHIDYDARGALVNQRNQMKPVVDWLKKEQAELDKLLRFTKPEGFQHVQGAAVMLSEVLAFLENPEEAFMALQVKATTDKVSPRAKTQE